MTDRCVNFDVFFHEHKKQYFTLNGLNLSKTHFYPLFLQTCIKLVRNCCWCFCFFCHLLWLNIGSSNGHDCSHVLTHLSSLHNQTLKNQLYKIVNDLLSALDEDSLSPVSA